MAFGRKKQQDEAPDAPAFEAAPKPAEDEQLGADTFAGSGETAGGVDGITAGLAPAETADTAADPLAGDLLNMFQTTKIEAEDLSAILELAGDVEIDDLLEELHTVALALGCQLEQVDAEDDVEALAA